MLVPHVVVALEAHAKGAGRGASCYRLGREGIASLCPYGCWEDSGRATHSDGDIEQVPAGTSTKPGDRGDMHRGVQFGGCCPSLWSRGQGGPGAAREVAGGGSAGSEERSERCSEVPGPAAWPITDAMTRHISSSGGRAPYGQNRVTPNGPATSGYAVTSGALQAKLVGYGAESVRQPRHNVLALPPRVQGFVMVHWRTRSSAACFGRSRSMARGSRAASSV